VFWLNVPLATIFGAGLVIATRRTAHVAPSSGSSIDWVSASLLGLGLGLLVVALYPDDPDHRATGSLVIPAGISSIVVLAAYGWRQVRRLEPLVPRDLLGSRAFVGAAISNVLIGAALMVALVDVPVLGRLVFNLDQLGSGLLLSRFLAGIPAGAVLGGWLAGRIGGRVVGVAGMVLSAAAFVQMSTWPANALALHLGPLRQADVALFACGLGFGLVIAPLTAAVLAMTRGASHGLATSLVVLARTMGMTVGLSALTAFGLYRFHQILGTPVVTDPDLKARVDHLARLVAAAFLQEYREIFSVAAALCALSALVMLVTIKEADGKPSAAS
jgi:MFS family permease